MSTKATYILCLVVAVAAATPVARAASWYVTPTGAGAKNGADWGNAFDSIQDAVIAAANPTDTIHLKHGTYTLTQRVSIWSEAALTLAGGYVGTPGDEPGPRTNRFSILKQTTANVRVIYAAYSTLDLDRLELTGGYLTPGGSGGALYAYDCSTTVLDCFVHDNSIMSGGAQCGNGVYSEGGSLTVVDTDFSGNYSRSYVQGANKGYGAAVYALDAPTTLSNCTFTGNYLYTTNDNTATHAYGGAIYLSGSRAAIVDCHFSNNAARAKTDGHGGAVYAESVDPLTIDACSFSKNTTGGSAGGTIKGSVLFLTGASLQATVSNCELIDNDLGRPWQAIYIDSGTLTMRDNMLKGNVGDGLTVDGGVVNVANCLVAVSGNDGVGVAGGTVTIVNSTLADNGEWGARQSGGTVTISNSIAWENEAGGLYVTNGTIAYTCAQESHAGTSNRTDDPLLVYGYYLSAAGLLGQAEDSPSIDVGACSADAVGLDDRTTRTDGTNDSDRVDLGYHYDAGLPPEIISNITLYVDAVDGDDANTGWSPGSAIQTIKRGLEKAIRGSTFHIAVGTYRTGIGEVFPLSISEANLSLKGTNRTTTLVRGDGAHRVFDAHGKGELLFEGMTIEDGYMAGKDGAGLYLYQCQTTLRNCLIRNNRIIGWRSQRGAGLYSELGSLIVLDSVFSGNYSSSNVQGYNYGRGGALYAYGVDLIVSNTVFDANHIYTGNNNTPTFTYGGAVYLYAGTALLTDCTFTDNYSQSKTYGYGGAIYAGSVIPFKIAGCTFSGNYVNGGGHRRGGTLFLSSANVTLLECELKDNGISATFPGDLYVNSGKVHLTNTLVAANWGSGIVAKGGLVYVDQCTFADNELWGVEDQGGSALIRNSIAWNNGAGGIEPGAQMTVVYSCAQEAHDPELGNMMRDPLFIHAAKSYQLMSRAGHRTADSWRRDNQTSPCIDAGDPLAPYAREIWPHGARVNMGTHGNTPYASKTFYPGTLLIITGAPF